MLIFACWYDKSIMDVLSNSADDVQLDALLQDLAAIQVHLDLAIRDGIEERHRMQTACTKLGNTMRSIHEARRAEAPGDRPAAIEREMALSRLSAREKEVLRLIAQGYSTKEIAGTLNISFKTAVTHRTHLLRKLQLHESASLVRIAIRAGLVAA
jgi:DNA-binding NarL/FixJ family response regulator